MQGGGIVNGFFNAQATLINSTISGNTAPADDPHGTGYGGGIVNDATLTLINSTVSDNSASTGGGGILIESSTSDQQPLIAQADFTFSTIYGNRAPVGADIAVKDGSVKIRNSIVAGDPAHRGPDIAGTLTSNGYKLFQDNSGTTLDPATSKLHGTNKTLSANDLTTLFADPVGLRDNGGPTRTLALGPGSPALDKIPLDACRINGISTDQRGVKRPQGSACDIGAYEYVPSH